MRAKVEKKIFFIFTSKGVLFLWVIARLFIYLGMYAQEGDLRR